MRRKNTHDPSESVSLARESIDLARGQISRAMMLEDRCERVAAGMAAHFFIGQAATHLHYAAMMSPGQVEEAQIALGETKEMLDLMREGLAEVLEEEED